MVCRGPCACTYTIHAVGGLPPRKLWLGCLAVLPAIHKPALLVFPLTFTHAPSFSILVPCRDMISHLGSD